MPDLTPNAPESPANVVVSTLTDGTGISRLTTSKVLKDFVLDFLMTAGATVTAANVLSVQDAIQAPEVVGFAVAGALVHTVVRLLLRWATSP